MTRGFHVFEHGPGIGPPERAFPLGRLLARPFLTYRDDELSRRQVESDHHTVGWMDELVTHTLRPAEVGETVMDIENQEFHWTAESRAQPLKMSGALLRPVDRAPAKWTPFYVVRVSDKIIKDHGAFWESSFPDFVSWFIALPLREAPRTAEGRLPRRSRSRDAICRSRTSGEFDGAGTRDPGS